MKDFTGPLADRFAIRERIDSYNDAVFRRDADDWAACWAEDAEWVVGENAASGRTAIRELWLKLMGGLEAAAMYVTHGAVAIEGDAATARCYMLEILKRKNGGEMLVSGRYEDKLRRDDDGEWRFMARSYTVLQAR